ncbi:hypothetical protein [Nitrososphaera sp.]|uniref:hypothetical protein n=1 Tax=Nitrososphaera sp. TaxID=1971748 RepID=UPI0031769DDA
MHHYGCPTFRGIDEESGSIVRILEKVKDQNSSHPFLMELFLPMYVLKEKESLPGLVSECESQAKD